MSDDKIENMLSQLIKMVGNIQFEQQEMKLVQKDMQNRLQNLEARMQGLETKVQGLETRMQGLETRMQGLETKEEEHHKELLARFTSLENDQDFIWEKTARNEREIGNIKRQLG